MKAWLSDLRVVLSKNIKGKNIFFGVFGLIIVLAIFGGFIGSQEAKKHEIRSAIRAIESSCLSWFKSDKDLGERDSFVSDS